MRSKIIYIMVPVFLALYMAHSSPRSANSTNTKLLESNSDDETHWIDSATDIYGRVIWRMSADGAVVPYSFLDIELPQTGTPVAHDSRFSTPSRHGIFNSYHRLPTIKRTTATAIGDVTGDGLNDVVAVNAFYDSLFVFPQLVSGGVNAHRSYAVPIPWEGVHQGSVDIADFNLDGLQDVVLGMPNTIGILLQNRQGLLDDPIQFATSHTSFTNVHQIGLGDLNGDSLIDVVAIDAGRQSHAVYMFHQEPAGLLSTPLIDSIAHGGYDAVAVSDLNSDGLMDIVVMSGQLLYDNFGILHQNPFGGFHAPVYFDLGGGELGRGLAVGDLNSDGRDDVAFSVGGHTLDEEIAVFYQNEKGIVDTALLLPAFNSPSAMKVADINMDGRKDLLVIHGGWAALGVFLQEEDGTLAWEYLYQTTYASHFNTDAMSVGDLNQDSKPDVAFANYREGVTVMYNATKISRAVDIDIEPGSCDNIFKLKRGDYTAITEVTVFGMKDLNVRRIDPSTVTLGRIHADRWTYDDIGTSCFQSDKDCECDVSHSDGIEDMVFTFRNANLVAGLGHLQHNDTLELGLSGFTYDGDTVGGSDWVRAQLASDVDQDDPRLRREIVIKGNYPNPFNPSTDISFILPQSAHVRLDVFNIAGRRVATLVDGRLESDEHQIHWDGRDESGQPVSSGIYFYRLESDGISLSRKMLLLK